MKINYKNILKRFINVSWTDPCMHEKIIRIKLNNLKHYLANNKTYGKLIAQDKDIIIIATLESSTDGVDIIAIPKCLVKKIDVLS